MSTDPINLRVRVKALLRKNDVSGNCVIVNTGDEGGKTLGKINQGTLYG